MGSGEDISKRQRLDDVQDETVQPVEQLPSEPEGHAQVGVEKGSGQGIQDTDSTDTQDGHLNNPGANSNDQAMQGLEQITSKMNIDVERGESMDIDHHTDCKDKPEKKGILNF